MDILVRAQFTYRHIVVTGGNALLSTVRSSIIQTTYSAVWHGVIRMRAMLAADTVP